MGANSHIQWTDHTFNPWIGCTRVSPGCVNCYAETLMDKRYHRVQWGPKGARSRTSEANWRKPIAWNRQAEAEGRRYRVFCASLADVFDPHPSILPEWREDLWRLIEATPHLDWQLLTKRPELVMATVPDRWQITFPRNVWLGASAEDQQRWDERASILANMGAAHLVFVSAEPLVGPIVAGDELGVIEWVIIGGESGGGARSLDITWVRSLIDQCRQHGSAPFVKQLGAKPYRPGHTTSEGLRRIKDPKGGDWSEWPEDLRVREMPR